MCIWSGETPIQPESHHDAAAAYERIGYPHQHPDDEPVEEAKGSSFCAPMGSTKKSRKDAFFGHEYVEKLRSDHLQVKIGNCSVDTKVVKIKKRGFSF